MNRPPLPPFTAETAAQKVRIAEDAWNTRDRARVALAYTPDSRWRNRVEFLQGRDEIEAFLKRKWSRELDYRLIKELWAFRENCIAVRFAYEWRIYRCVPGRKPALLSRFENETLRIWEKHGIRQAGFWTTLIGMSSQEITYVLAWDSLAEREKRWAAFLADPEWSAVVARTEKDGQLVENISSQLLAPAAFSAVK